MIDIDNLTFAYRDGLPIFERFSWQVARGEAWAVIGPSGCGKTTLLYLVAGLRMPTAGAVHVDGRPIARPRPETGLILQDHGLLPWATVWQNAHLGLKLRAFYGPDGRHAPPGDRLSREEAEARVAHWLTRLGIDSLADQYPAQLSGGQRQRTAIARTLVMEPDLLLMDEPFSALDAATREDLQALVLALRRTEHLTTVLVTHSIEEAVLLSEHILALGNTLQIVHNPGMGMPSYREMSAFRDRCDELRAVLGDAL